MVHSLLPCRKDVPTTTWSTLPLYSVNIIKQRRRILCLYRSTGSDEHRCSLYSLNKYIHYELRAVKRAQWHEFRLGLEPKNTQRFWNHSKNLFKKRATRIQGFLDERNHPVITNVDAMTEHARQYYSEAFREKENSSQNQEVAEFKENLAENLAEKLAELPSKPFVFSINDLHRSIHRLKTTSNARRYDSLDPRLNILKSLFSTRFIHASPSIRINRTIIENSLGPRCVCSPLYELQSFTTTPSSSSRTRLKFSNIG